MGKEHVECKACLAEVEVPGYCAGHPGTQGCWINKGSSSSNVVWLIFDVDRIILFEYLLNWCP